MTLSNSPAVNRIMAETGMGRCQAVNHLRQREALQSRHRPPPHVRWFIGQLDDYGSRLEEHQARIDRNIAAVDAALTDYRSVS